MNLKVKPIIIFLLASMALQNLQAQDVWSLERCIRYAQDNNITVQQAKASVKTALLTQRQAKASRLPNLSANINAGEQFGRTIDPTTNTFGTTAIGFNSISVNAGVTLFNGGLINQTIKQAGYDVKASEADAEQLGNNLALQIASAYLNVLLSEEQLESATRRVDQSKQQLSNTLKLISAGTLPMADRYSIDAQIASNEQAAVRAQNTVDIAYLTLKQLLQLEPDAPLSIERPTFQIPSDANPEALALGPVYSTAVNTQPTVRAADYRIQSAQVGIDLARSAYYPTITLFGGLSSNYSTAFQKAVVGPDELITQTVNINGQDVTVGFYQPTVSFQDIPYFNQIDQNFGQSLGLSINFPIYQNGRVNLNVERARLNVLTAQMQSIQTQQQLKNDIQTAIANARAARKQLDAAQKTFDASRIAFENMEKRHTIGAVNTLDLTTARNNLDIAENDLIVAKYDYLFRLKIIDFYEGKPLKIDN